MEADKAIRNRPSLPAPSGDRLAQLVVPAEGEGEVRPVPPGGWPVGRAGTGGERPPEMWQPLQVARTRSAASMKLMPCSPGRPGGIGCRERV